jgi:hypothetical protein
MFARGLCTYCRFLLLLELKTEKRFLEGDRIQEKGEKKAVNTNHWMNGMKTPLPAQFNSN